MEDPKQEEQSSTSEPQPSGEANPAVDQVPAAEEPQAEASSLDAALVERAKAYGMSEDDLKSYGPNAREMVERFASLYEGQVSALGRVQPAAEQGTQAKPSAEEADPTEPILKALSEGGYEKEDPIFKAVEALAKQNAELRSAVSSRTANDGGDAAFRESEAFFNTVPEEFRDLVGKGSTFDLAQGSKEFDFRMKMVEEMAALQRGYRQIGKDVPVAELGKKALQILAGDRAVEIARKQLAGKIAKRAAGVTTAPGGLSTDANVAQSRSEAMGELAAAMKETGLMLK
jgi:hypothetical protein